jgi:hypothetical protein
MTRGGKILSWVFGLLSFGLFSLWAIGRLSTTGIVVARNQNQLANTSITPFTEISPTNTRPETITSSSDLAKNLLVDIVSLKREGLTGTENNAKLVDNLSEKVLKGTESLSFTAISVGEIKTVEANEETIRTYKAAVKKSIGEAYFKGLGDEIELWLKTQNGDASEKQKAEALKKLSLAYEAYRKLADDFRTMPVPKTVVTPHLKLANAFLGMATAMSSLEKTNDVVVGLPAIKLYFESLETVQF